MIICLDLALIIYIPLYPPHKRNKYYHIIFLFLCLLIIPLDMINSRCNIYFYNFIAFLQNKSSKLYFSDMIINLTFAIACMTIAIVSLIYFVIRTRKTKKLDKKINSLLMRYFIYGIIFLFYIICMILGLLSTFYEIFSSMTKSVITIYMSVQFLIFFILRITEPYTLKFIRYKVKYYWATSRELKYKFGVKIMESEDWLLKTPSLFLLLQTKLSAQVNIFINTHSLCNICSKE